MCAHVARQFQYLKATTLSILRNTYPIDGLLGILLFSSGKFRYGTVGMIGGVAINR
jgi:hypothetical protein